MIAVLLDRVSAAVFGCFAAGLGRIMLVSDVHPLQDCMSLYDMSGGRRT